MLDRKVDGKIEKGASESVGDHAQCLDREIENIKYAIFWEMFNEEQDRRWWDGMMGFNGDRTVFFKLRRELRHR